MLSVSKFCLDLRRRFIHRWLPGEALDYGLNYRPEKSSWALLFPIWFPFYGWYSHPSYMSPCVALVLPVLAVGWFRYELPKYDHFYWNWWRWPLVREPFGMRPSEALKRLRDDYWGDYFSLQTKMKSISYALWSLKRQGWSTDKIVERVNGV